MKHFVLPLAFLILLALADESSSLYANPPDTTLPAKVSAENAVYVEQAAFVLSRCTSINYERSVSQVVWFRFGYGSGKTGSFSGSFQGWGRGPMVMLMLLTKGGSSRFEAGAGGSFMYGRSSYNRSGARSTELTIHPSASVGYRFQPIIGGVVLRAGLTYDYYGGFPFQISLGYAF